jgi:hypothetical protein
MPLAEFNFPAKNIRRQKRMFPPKKVYSLPHWQKQARKLIPDIPDAPNGYWRILHEDVTVQWIKLTYESTAGERCYLTIDRTAPSIG